MAPQLPFVLVAVLVLLPFTGCSSTDKPKAKPKGASHLPKKGQPEPELEVVELEEGTGPKPREGQTVVVHYTGTLTNGEQFDSSVDRGKPFEFVLGKGKVIQGWHDAVAAMKVGGKYKVTVPPSLGYGSKGKDDIPPNATLVFEMELLAIKDKSKEAKGDRGGRPPGGMGGMGGRNMGGGGMGGGMGGGGMGGRGGF